MLIFYISSLSQNAPSLQIKDNDFYGRSINKVKSEYETLNLIYFKKDSIKIVKLKIDINQIIKSIKDNSDETQDKKLTDNLAIKEKYLLKAEVRKDSLYNEYIKDYLEYNPSTIGFWKYRSPALFDLIYHDDSKKRFQLLNNTGFNIGNNTGSIYSELVSGHMYIFRVSLGAMVASNSATDPIESKQEEAFQRLTTYGGNTVLTLEYPLWYAHTKNNQAIILTRIMAKGTADFPQFGTTSKDWAGSASFGIDFYADVATSNNEIRFFTNVNWNKYYGTNTFAENLAILDNKFSFGQVKLGVTFKNISLSFIVATFSSEDMLRDRNVIAGGQILH